MRKRILIFDSYPTCYQMRGMFNNATAFNQDLSTFDTSAVTDVSVYIVVRLDEKPIFIFLPNL